MWRRDFPTISGFEKLRYPCIGDPYTTMNAVNGLGYLVTSSYVIIPPLLSPETKTLDVSTQRLAKAHSMIFSTNSTSS